MKNIITLIWTLIVTSSFAFAGPDCTKDPKELWKDQKVFQQSLIEQGYKIKIFKVTPGNCYEIYGWNNKGVKVEIYFNPVTGAVVKERIG